MQKVIRQGDVAVVVSGGKPPVGKLTKVKRENGRVILAHGEVTGHAHAICEEDVDLFVDEEGNLFLQAGTEAALTHEEHRRSVGDHRDGFPVIPKGLHPVFRQREYEPAAPPRPVAD